MSEADNRGLIVVAQQPPEKTSRAIITLAAIEQEAEQRKLLQKYVQSQMVSGTDYGVIPGTTQNTLLKPGAEKLFEIFRCEPECVLEKSVEDWDKGVFHYMFRITAVSRETGARFAVGYGSANSKEGRYRWRNGERKCPACGKATIIVGKAEYGGGFVCFAKKGGCGAKYKSDDQAITSQQVGKVENDDIFTQVNTIMKMAKKRAMVDCAIALARVSNLFTQDIEDMQNDDDDRWAPQPPLAQAQSRPPEQPQAATPPAPVVTGSLPMAKQKELLDELHRIKRAWNDLEVKARISKLIGREVKPEDHISTLSIEEADMIIAKFKEKK